MVKEFKTILFGGAFDPPHLGHVAIVQTLLKNFPISEIEVIPSFCPPLKSKPFFSFEERISFCDFSFSSVSDKINISNIEKTLSQPSFFLNTLNKYIQNGYSNIAMTIGFDQFQNLHNWFQFEKLLSKVNLIILDRKKEFTMEVFKKSLNKLGLLISREDIENKIFQLNNKNMVHFVELNQSFSSSAARLAISNKKMNKLETMLHPRVFSEIKINKLLSN